MRPPLERINGKLMPIGDDPLGPETIVEMLEPLIPARLRDQLAAEQAIEFGYGIQGVSRFRAAVFHQRGTLAAVFRRVPFDFPSLEDWGLPQVLYDFCDLPQGLVLITGPTGSGKSSTLAGMMRHISKTRHEHIVSIEDPIEFLIGDYKASVSQREIGIDTPCFGTALKNALRQDPDVIMVGEMRDEETIQTVLTAAETGHLVFSTLHTNSAPQTVDRIVSCFPKSSHPQVRQQLSSVLEAVVSMQLVTKADGEGMIAAVEILRRTPRVSKLILTGDLETLLEELESSVAFYKMQTMNQSLASLVLHDAITRETAMSASANPADLDLLFRKLGWSENNGTEEQGEEMAECKSDFSKILELQEIKSLYDDLQERYSREISSRDQEIATLRADVTRLGDKAEEETEIARLRSENERLAEQTQATRNEYEAKMERLNARVRELSQKNQGEAAAATERRGLFRR
jgi:twitching motility protein PilT